MANTYYRILVKQTSRFGRSSGHGPTTKNVLKDWLRSYVDQRGKEEANAKKRGRNPQGRDAEGRRSFEEPQLPSLKSNNRNPFDRDDVVPDTLLRQQTHTPLPPNSLPANLWVGGFFSGEYGIARTPDEQNAISSATADLAELITLGTNRQKEWVEKVARHWEQLLLSPFSTQKRTEGIRYAISLDIGAKDQLKDAGIPAALALRVIWQDSLETYAKIEGFTKPNEQLGWIAGLHQDKEHLHLHVALFPTTSLGNPLRLSDKPQSADPDDQHITRLVAIANIQAEKFWRSNLPDIYQNPAVQLARLTNQPDPESGPNGIELKHLLPIYCSNNKALKHFPFEQAQRAFDALTEQQAEVDNLIERISILNSIPHTEHKKIFTAAAKQTGQQKHPRSSELHDLDCLRKLCLRHTWSKLVQPLDLDPKPDPYQFARLFRSEWSGVLQELQNLTTKSSRHNTKDIPLPEFPLPHLNTLFAFAQDLQEQHLASLISQPDHPPSQPAHFWLFWIAKRREELFELVREDFLKETEKKNQLQQTLLDALDQLARANSPGNIIASLKAKEPLLWLQLQNQLAQTATDLKPIVLQQALTQHLYNLTTKQRTGDKLTNIQGLRQIIAAAQLVKNEETRLANAKRPHSPHTGTLPTPPAYRRAYNILKQILSPDTLTSASFNFRAINQQLSSLSPKEILIQNPQLLWELRQIQRQRESQRELAQAASDKHTDPEPASTAAPKPADPALESGPPQYEPPPAASQIRDLLKGFNVKL